MTDESPAKPTESPAKPTESPAKPSESPAKPSAFSPLRVLLYLALGAGVLVFLMRSGSPAYDAASLMSLVQAAEVPTGEYTSGAAAAQVYREGMGYKLTVHVESHPDFTGEGFFSVTHITSTPLSGQLILKGEGRLLDAEQTQAFAKGLGIDLEPWEALCTATSLPAPLKPAEAGANSSQE